MKLAFLSKQIVLVACLASVIVSSCGDPNEDEAFNAVSQAIIACGQYRQAFAANQVEKDSPAGSSEGTLLALDMATRAVYLAVSNVLPYETRLRNSLGPDLSTFESWREAVKNPDSADELDLMKAWLFTPELCNYFLGPDTVG